MKVPRLARAHSKRSGRSPAGLGLERLEDRQLLTTFQVSNLNASGPGSLRQAVLLANAMPSADTIDFSVSGTVRARRFSLPAITSPVDLDGTSAPGYAGAPVVTVDFHGTRGLLFAPGSDGSSVRGLSLVRAGNSGITLDASRISVQGNYIGLMADGRTAAGNRGDGIRINSPSRLNLIGNSTAVSGTTFYNADAVSMQPVTAWQGIRATSATDVYLITGTSNSNGLLYVGPISGQGGQSFSVNVPGASSTSVYGPDDLGNGQVRLVGSYRAQGNTSQVQGFLFQGSAADLSDSADYTTIDYPGAQFTYIHSTMGNYAVGNADGPEADLPIGTGHAFLYNVGSQSIQTDIVYPGATTTTAYGIWANSNGTYTIAGGYSSPGDAADGLSHGYLVDYDPVTGRFLHWTSFDDPNKAPGQTLITHFEGISSDQSGVYTLAANSTSASSGQPEQGSWVSVRRNADGSFGPAVWTPLSDPSNPGGVSANSVAGQQVVGIIFGASDNPAYQAAVNVGFQLSNVISGNRGNGIGVYNSPGNVISMNNIGTDVTGTRAVGNGLNGIRMTGSGSFMNLIGGQATGGNDPTAGVFARPPQGNLISGNRGNGVQIDGALEDTLSGNFIGTDASGNSALGNRLDGVAIEHSGDIELTGTTFRQKPFVFYNVISGNGGNGLRITDSVNTYVQANFLGAGANNASVVANHGDGVLVSGSSQNTQIGGVIPLGNVISGNDRNGTEIRDKAWGTVNFNTFAGVFAFSGAAPNKRDGFLITSTGGNNQIRTCIVAGNLGNGIEIGGHAQGVQVEQTAAGTDSFVQYAIPNGGSGLVISGQARNNRIGGFQPSVETQNDFSGNVRYGIEVTGRAHDNVIFNTFVGQSDNTGLPIPNQRGGIYLGAGTSATTVGSQDGPRNLIAHNAGPGVILNGSRNNLILNNEITDNSIAGVQASGDVSGSGIQSNDIHGNRGDGVRLWSTRRLTVGGGLPALGNRIVSNQAYGLIAQGYSPGTLVQNNTVRLNARGNVNLSHSRGVTYIP